MGRGKLQMKPFLFSDPGQGFLASMRRPIVQDDIEFLVRIALQQPAEEPNESFTVVVPDRLTVDLSAVDFQGSQQRGGPVALILVTEPFNPMWFHGQPRLGPIQ